MLSIAEGSQHRVSYHAVPLELGGLSALVKGAFLSWSGLVPAIFHHGCRDLAAVC